LIIRRSGWLRDVCGDGGTTSRGGHDMKDGLNKFIIRIRIARAVAVEIKHFGSRVNGLVKLSERRPFLL
jgi:hypothetical protein